MYTLYGHEGPTQSAGFSPLGDYILSTGDDQNVVVWQSNLNGKTTEVLHGTTQAKVGTDVFITDKANIANLPSSSLREQGVEKRKEVQTEKANSKAQNGRRVTVEGAAGSTNKANQEGAAGVGSDGKVLGGKAIGPTYKMLKPEVKQTLEKVMYQLDLVKNTLGLMERRITNSEANLVGVMNYIRQEDINYVSGFFKISRHFYFLAPKMFLKILSKSLFFKSAFLK